MQFSSQPQEERWLVRVRAFMDLILGFVVADMLMTGLNAREIASPVNEEDLAPG
jgi:hypothetical protein